MNALKAVNILNKSDDLLQFLEKDLKNIGECGALIDNSGNMYNTTVGDVTGVEIDADNSGNFIGIHTHPSTSEVEISEGDIRSTNYPNISASIILCQEMFETVWTGVSFTVDNMDIIEQEKFKIVCDGSTDGPSNERHIQNPQIIY